MNILVSHQAAPTFCNKISPVITRMKFFYHSRIIISVMLRGANVEVRLKLLIHTKTVADFTSFGTTETPVGNFSLQPL